MVIGFTLNKNDPKIRHPCEYDSNQERAWCECSELADAELWKEAEEKLDEYYELCGGYIKGDRDAVLTIRIEVGLTGCGAKTTQKEFENSLSAWQFAISQDMGNATHVLARLAADLTENYLKYCLKMPRTCPYRGDDSDPSTSDYYNPDFDKATTASLINAAQFLVKIFQAVELRECILSEYCDDPHDKIHGIIDTLLERNEIAAVRPIVQKIFSKYGSDPFFADFAKFWLKDQPTRALDSDDDDSKK